MYDLYSTSGGTLVRNRLGTHPGKYWVEISSASLARDTAVGSDPRDYRDKDTGLAACSPVGLVVKESQWVG